MQHTCTSKPLVFSGPLLCLEGLLLFGRCKQDGSAQLEHEGLGASSRRDFPTKLSSTSFTHEKQGKHGKTSAPVCQCSVHCCDCELAWVMLLLNTFSGSKLAQVCLEARPVCPPPCLWLLCLPCAFWWPMGWLIPKRCINLVHWRLFHSGRAP